MAQPIKGDGDFTSKASETGPHVQMASSGSHELPSASVFSFFSGIASSVSNALRAPLVNDLVGKLTATHPELEGKWRSLLDTLSYADLQKLAALPSDFLSQLSDLLAHNEGDGIKYFNALRDSLSSGNFTQARQLSAQANALVGNRLPPHLQAKLTILFFSSPEVAGDFQPFHDLISSWQTYDERPEDEREVQFGISSASLTNAAMMAIDDPELPKLFTTIGRTGAVLNTQLIDEAARYGAGIPPRDYRDLPILSSLGTPGVANLEEFSSTGDEFIFHITDPNTQETVTFQEPLPFAREHLPLFHQFLTSPSDTTVPANLLPEFQQFQAQLESAYGNLYRSLTPGGQLPPVTDAGSGHIRRLESGELTLIDDAPGATLDPFAREGLRDIVDKPNQLFGDTVPGGGKVMLTLERERVELAGQQLIKITTRIKGVEGGSESSRDSFYLIPAGKSEEDVLREITDTPRLERDVLLAKSRYIKEHS